MKEGWTYKKLGEVCEKITDGSHNPPKGIEKSNNYMLSSQNVQNGYLDMSSVRYLSDDDFRIENQRTQVSKGDVLLTIVGTIGRTCVINGNEGNITFQRSVAVLKPKSDINPRFLMFYLLSHNSKLNAKAQGAAQKGIYLKQLGNITLYYPPLSEQQAIVSRLDSAFAQIDALKANAEKQLEEARKLFQAELTETMKPKEGWEEKTLKEIGETQTGTTPSKSDSSNYGGYMPFIRPAELDFDGIGGIQYESEIKLSEKGVKKSRLIKSDSILMCCIGSVGKMGFSTRDVTCNQQINTITPTSAFCPKFVYYAMHDNKFLNEVIKEAKSAQATLPIISKGKWEKHRICYPSLSEQQKIVSRLDALSSNVKRLEELQQKTLAECDALKQAMLREVFE